MTIHAQFFRQAISISNVGQTELVFGVRLGFFSRSVQCMQVSVCSGNMQTHRQHLISLHEQLSQLS